MILIIIIIIVLDYFSSISLKDERIGQIEQIEKSPQYKQSCYQVAKFNEEIAKLKKKYIVHENIDKLTNRYDETYKYISI